MQLVPQAFIDRAKAPLRKLTYGLYMAFDKTLDTDVGIFTLDSSQLDGPDLLQPSDYNVLQEWDYYKFLNYTSRVVSIEWTRELDFPHSVISAMADVVVSNHDNYFTPNSGSPIDTNILPKRPMRLLAGYGTNIPQFVGLTEKMPVIDETSKTASFHGIDFLSQMFTMRLNKTIAMQNARTDEVLAVIFEQFGLAPDQYNLPRCQNVIPFVFFEKKADLAGEVIRKLMQAEMGNLWLDERGVIQLDPRISPQLDPVWTFDDTNVIDVKTTGDSRIINTVKIYTDIRQVQEYQVVFSKAESDSNLFVIDAGQSREFEADLQDPALTVEAPAFGLGSDVSWFTAEKTDGAAVTTGLTVTASELRTNSFVFTVQNNNGFAVNLDRIELWGQPAKVVDRIEYTEIDQDSIDKYEEQVIEIDNNFIQSVEQCDSLALIILDQFAEYANEVEITVKSNLALQLGDVVQLNVKSYTGKYKLIKAYNRLQGGGSVQTFTARKTTERAWFVLNQSLLDGPDILTP